MRERSVISPAVGVMALGALVASCTSATREAVVYPPGEPRPTQEHCAALPPPGVPGMEGLAGTTAEQLCMLALEGDKPAQLEAAHRYRDNGDTYLWLYWLARAASPEAVRPVTVYVPPIGDESYGTVMTSGDNVLVVPGSADARAEIDRELDAVRPRADGVGPARGPAAAIPFGISCDECTTSRDSQQCKWFPSSRFVAVAENPVVEATTPSCTFRDPESVREETCRQERILSTVRFDQVSVLHDEENIGSQYRYIVRDYDGISTNTDLISKILNLDKIILFSNTSEEIENGPIRVIGAVCNLVN